MTLKSWIAGLTGAAALGLVTLPAAAAPTGGLAAPQGAAAETSNVQPAHWEGRRYHYRHYRHGYRHYGYRPGVRFYYGPRHHHRHRHWRRW